MGSKKLIAIIGPTASGKSAWGVDLAKKCNGEIISADSRQIYKGLDLGSGKITPEEMKGVPHHLLDVAELKDGQIPLSQYLKLARQALNKIWAKDKLPFLVGGTGLYITALIEGYQVPEVPPQPDLRQKLEAKPVSELAELYQSLDPKGYHLIDRQNPRRLIRAIEVVKISGRPFHQQTEKQTPEFESLVLGIETDFEILKQKIKKRIEERFEQGMLDEVIELNQAGIPWKSLENLGLEYKWLSKLAKNEIEAGEALKNLEKESITFAKRQLTWWRKREVVWVKSLEEAEKLTADFLKTGQLNRLDK